MLSIEQEVAKLLKVSTARVSQIKESEDVNFLGS
jgi:hypothetical protein